MSKEHMENQKYYTAHEFNTIINMLIPSPDNDDESATSQMDIEYFLYFGPYFHQEFSPDKEDFREYDKYSTKNKELVKQLISQYKIRIKRLKKLIKN